MRIFCISNFWVDQAGRQNVGRIITKLLNSVWGHETDLHTKFKPIGIKIAHVSPFGRFSVGRLVGLCQHDLILKKKVLMNSVLSRYTSMQKINAIPLGVLELQQKKLIGRICMQQKIYINTYIYIISSNIYQIYQKIIC